MAGLDCRAILCCLIAGLLTAGTASAAEPARSAKARQREAVEAILAKPVEWTPQDPQSITIDAFITHVREKHGLAVRWDAASVQLLGDAGELLGSLRRSVGGPVAAWKPGAASQYVQTYSTDVPARLRNHVTNFAPPIEPAQPTPLPGVILPDADAPAVKAKPAPAPEKPAKIVVEDAEPAPTADEDDEALPHRVLAAKPISPSVIALTGASVGETLEQLLIAAAPPIADTGESLGVPLVIRAFTLDYIIDGRSVVITTRLRANSAKETRVYRITNLKGLPLEHVAKTICHSIRPWSWRSQASEIVDRLATRFPKGALTLPQISVASQYISNPILMTSGEAPDVEPTVTPPSPLPQQSAPISPEPINPAELAAIGQLLAGGAIAAVESIVNAFEIVHYGDPPTGVMEVLPGVLVITQSQRAHREIAELLEELAAAGAP
jgi:hypothetical protein